VPTPLLISAGDRGAGGSGPVWATPTGDRYRPLNLTAQKRREGMLRAQVAQVEGLSARQPVLMVFEDVHWSDPTTRESLDVLIDRIPTLRVCCSSHSGRSSRRPGSGALM
jgi:predicted ATPase